ncbi:hypothetical protein QFC19_007321 [Naganishia cerealis]|uniref:Uncharacterized protein n=1 Tax=Naganishia cerealis TaxID=610337 RepID=A0ACC2VAG6_9TREE|nr:hypothetical protein QFC19_007321 [Naganishia cerealis]
MSPTAPNTISPQQGGQVLPSPAPHIAGTSVGNVPGAAKTGLGSDDVGLPEPKQSVIGDPNTAADTKIEPLDKDQVPGVSGGAAGTAAKDAQTILDDLSNSATVTAPSAGQALSSAQASVTSAINTAATTAQGLANQAYEAVLGGNTESK